MDGWLPQGPKTRRTFLALVIGLCLILGCVRWVLLPIFFHSSSGSFDEVTDQMIGDIIATVLAATALALILERIFPRSPRPPIVETVPAHEIGQRLEGALGSTRRWWFDGSTGRYQRSMTMPELARLARRSGASREVNIVILDPRNEDVCRRYGNYRSGVAKAGESYSIDRVRTDIYATILSALDHNARAPLNVTVALKTTMSILRYDLSDGQLIITKEGTTDPAIAYPSDSFYYDAFLEQLRMSRKQAAELDLSEAKVPTAGFDRESARAALYSLELATESLEDDDVMDAIVKKAASREQPYP